MMICPRCGSFIDAGEPYCIECGYAAERIAVNCREYDAEELEEALREFGYELDDLNRGLIDDDLLREILENLERY